MERLVERLVFVTACPLEVLYGVRDSEPDLSPFQIAFGKLSIGAPCSLLPGALAVTVNDKASRSIAIGKHERIPQLKLCTAFVS